MPRRRSAGLDQVRTFFARNMVWASRSRDPRLLRVFKSVRREAFLPPGPWLIHMHHGYIETPDADPAVLYQNALVALDAARGINNGEPFLHAAWIGAVAPQPGDVICQIGAGTGFYTAILAMLALPGGRVEAFEVDALLAGRAAQNLRPFANASVIHGDATGLAMPPSDIIYVNASVVAPPLVWLLALHRGGRMIFPWQPASGIGVALLMTRRHAGFEVQPLMPAWFIPCTGASSADGCMRFPDSLEAWATRSAWLTADRAPDDSATAVYQHVWFSSAAAS